MQLVVDANILIAAFLKSAFTRELLFDEKVELFAPEYFVIEVAEVIKKNKFLRKRITLTREETEELLTSLLEPIKIIPEEEYSSFMDVASRQVPLDDAPYLALSLSLKIPIWSNDSAFKKQLLAKVYTTPELINRLEHNNKLS